MAFNRLIGILTAASSLCLSPVLHAQLFQITGTDDIRSCSRFFQTFTDSTLWLQTQQSLRECLLVEGFLTYESSLQQLDSHWVFEVAAGQAWKTHFRVEDQSWDDAAKRVEILDQWADAGYPFAQLQPDSVVAEAGLVEVRHQLLPGPLVLIDSILSPSTYTIPPAFIKHHFGLSMGNPYRQSVVDALELRARQLPFLRFQRPPALLFTQEGAWIFLYPEKEKANRFDLLIGFNNAPDQATRFSGQADIQLVNALKRGERIGVQWMAPPDGAQQLEMLLHLPYLWKSRFGWEGELNFYRKDSSFVNLDFVTRLRYAHRANAGVALLYRGQRSRLGNAGLDAGFQEVRKDLWGLELKIDQRNDNFSPDRGGLYRLEGSTGTRIAETERNTQVRLEGEVEYYQSLGGRHVLRTRLESAALIGGNLSQNELFRIGGREQLRGFAEQSIFTSRYGIGSLEYRYRLESSTYFQLFGDAALRESIEGSVDPFYGIGAGLSLLLTNAYIQIELGVPHFGEGFDFRSTVLHLGYAGRF